MAKLKSCRSVKRWYRFNCCNRTFRITPHISDIPHKDRNRPYEIAFNAAKESNLIVINGTEITRKFPPGHINAVFVKDANKLINIDRSRQSEVEEFIEALPDDLIQEYIDEPWLNDAVLAALWPIEETLLEAKQLRNNLEQLRTT